MAMKDLLYKEFKLAKHPTLFIFPFLGAMLLIPSYPYFVAFIYTCLSIFFIFLTGRENKDIFFTVSLPVRKRDTVKARCAFIVVIEMVQIVVAIPFAIIGMRINPNPQGNPVGIEANIAFFGLVFILYALYNVVFLPLFYKTGYRAGYALLLASLAVTIYIVAVEAAVQLIPTLKAWLDTTDPGMMVRQIPILVAGICIYILSMLMAYQKSAMNFEKVDL
jgi:hypothetical protein